MDLTFAGYRLSDVVGGWGPPGSPADAPVAPGSIRVHDSTGPVSGERVRVILLPPIDGDLVRRSLERSRSVDHPHLIPDVEVVEQDGRVAVVAPWTAGGTLDGLLRLRTRLAPAEALTVLRPLAAVLTTIGDAGLCHGALLPELVWFDEDGRPRLAGLTVGLAVASAAGADLIVPVGAPHLAPEVARGAAPDIRADLFSLGSIALSMVTGRSAWLAESAAEVLVQSAAGLWPEPDPALATPELAETISGLLAAHPQTRPPAAVVQVELRRAGRPRPVELTPRAPGAESTLGTVDPEDPEDPEDTVDQRGSLPAPPDEERPDGEDHGSPNPAPPGPVRASAAAGGPGRDGASRRGRSTPRRTRRAAGRRSGRGATRAVVVGFVVLLAGGLAIGGGLWWAAGEGPATAVLAADAAREGTDPGTAEPVLAAVVTAGPTPAEGTSSTEPAVIDWLEVVRQLDLRRAEALSAADPDLLAGVYVPGAAQDSDRALIDDLRGRGLRIDGGSHLVVSARVTSADTTPNSPGDEIDVEVEQSLASYPVLDTSGAQVGRTPAVESGRAVLRLRAVEGGFAVVSVRPS